MKKTLLLALCTMIAAVGVHAQEMDVVRSSGQVDAFDLADIDSITFGAGGAPAKSAPRRARLATNDVLRVHTQSGTFQFPVAQLDSVCFVDSTLLAVHQAAGGTSQFLLANIDSLTFADSPAENVVSITYSGTTATVVNPLEGAGVAVAVSGADVTVTSTAAAGVVYDLAGTTADGMFKIYSLNDFTLRLAGVQLANANGPAINIQADATIAVVLDDGTTSTLADGVTYAAAPGGEDQKAAFFSEGPLIFTGAGSLFVAGQGAGKHGLGSDDYVAVEDGNITVVSAVKDGVHTNEGYFQLGGAVQVTSAGDGVDAGDGPVEIGGGHITVLSQADDCDAIKCGGVITIAGGEVDLTVEGDQSKGLNAPDVRLTGGVVTIDTSGGAVLEPSGSGYDPSYCTAIKVDNLALLDGCQLTITATGTAGRGISSDGDIVIQSGSLSVASSGGGGVYTDPDGAVDAYTGPCLNADGDVTLVGGTVVLAHSGAGGKGISGDGDLTIGAAASSPTLRVTTTGAPIALGGGEYAEAKAVSVDGTITIDNGEITISSADDAIKSKHWLEVNGGLVNVTSSLEGLESPNLFINGGEVRVTSTDDGLNATYGVGGETSDGSVLTINGGYICLNAISGDGIDSNGNLTIAGGTIVVHGPPAQPEVGLDVNGTFLENGGFTVVSQINSNMLETPSGSSTQRSVLLRRTQALAAGTLFHIASSSGAPLVTFAPAHNYSSILLSTPNLVAGTTYRVYTGGTCTGTERDGLYTGGTYSDGTLRTTFVSGGTVQTVYF